MADARKTAMSHVDAHIAVVEDDAPVRRALVRVLVSAGFKVSSYATAEEFMALGGEPGPDCLLIDLHLPRMSGLDLHERLRRLRRETPVIFITADHELARSEAIRQVGVVCLTKPIEEDTMIAAIARATSPAPMGDA